MAADMKEKMIYFENIKYGLDNYANETIVLTEEEAYSFFADKLRKAEKGSAYADFYYKRLDTAARQMIDKELTEEERSYVYKLLEAELEENNVIYPLDETLLQIVTKLNARETLFCTLFFTGEKPERCTYWGNYNKEYIVFKEKEE